VAMICVRSHRQYAISIASQQRPSAWRNRGRPHAVTISVLMDVGGREIPSHLFLNVDVKFQDIHF